MNLFLRIKYKLKKTKCSIKKTLTMNPIAIIMDDFIFNYNIILCAIN